jgi:cytochrome c2
MTVPPSAPARCVFSFGRLRILAGIAVPVLLLAALIARLSAGERPLEGNAFRGRQIFQEKRCATCHSVWGHGGTLGPEITVAVAGKTFYELVGDFWNHTPQMIDQVTRLGYPWPTLDPAEMADILGYLYYLRLFDEPGSPERGAEAYARLQCGACHTLGASGGSGDRPLDRFSAYPSSAALAQAMWNAGPRMQEAQVGRGMLIPQFTGHDVADLQAYIRAEGRRPQRDITLQPLPSPTRGADVFRTKGCGACHDRSRGLAPDLTRATLSKTASEITGLLWNHSYAMSGQMRARGVVFPRFSGNEMSDLIAHLYFLGYVGQEGDPKSGATVFAAKGCAACHAQGAAGAPNLGDVARRADRTALASAMWNHAPQMHNTMAERAAFWPKFEPGEMRNLAAYLRTLPGKPAPPPAGR